MENTVSQVESAQKKWSDFIIQIGKLYTEKKDYSSYTREHLTELYAFDKGSILFKPTLAASHPIRQNFEDSLSYFIGGNQEIQEDLGFALKPWKKIVFKNENIISGTDLILTMGHYFFTDYDNQQIKVEYSFGYDYSTHKPLKIRLHHSSLPYSE